MAGPHVPREELEAALAAGAELGPDYRAAVVEGVVDRLEATIDARIEARLEEERPAAQDDGFPLLPVISLGTGIPITAVAGGTAGLGGVVAAWVGIAAVNVAHALGRRTRR